MTSGPNPRRSDPTGRPARPRFGDEPISRRRAYAERYRYEREAESGSGGRLTGFLLTLTIVVLTILQGLWLVTAPDASARAYSAVLPNLTDLDQTLAANAQTLREEAAGLPSDAEVPVRGLPIEVTLPRDTALNADATQIRDEVLAAMTAEVYAEGGSAFRAPDAPPGSPNLLSGQWMLHRAFGLLSDGAHDAVRTPRLIALGAAIIFGALTLLLLEGPARLMGPGVAVAVGAVLAALLSGGTLGAVMLLFSGDSVVDGVIRRVTRETIETVLVVAVILAVFGGAVALAGLLLGRMDRAASAAQPLPVRPPAPTRQPPSRWERD